MDDISKRFRTLTRRERETALLVSQGLCNAEIAKRLGIGENTVRTMLQRAYDKLNVKTRLMLAVTLIHHHYRNPWRDDQ